MAADPTVVAPAPEPLQGLIWPGNKNSKGKQCNIQEPTLTAHKQGKCQWKQYRSIGTLLGREVESKNRGGGDERINTFCHFENVGI